MCDPGVLLYPQETLESVRKGGDLGGSAAANRGRDFQFLVSSRKDLGARRPPKGGGGF